MVLAFRFPHPPHPDKCAEKCFCKQLLIYFYLRHSLHTKKHGEYQFVIKIHSKIENAAF
jgi:hypothetical protein